SSDLAIGRAVVCNYHLADDACLVHGSYGLANTGPKSVCLVEARHDHRELDVWIRRHGRGRVARGSDVPGSARSSLLGMVTQRFGPGLHHSYVVRAHRRQVAGHICRDLLSPSSEHLFGYCERIGLRDPLRGREGVVELLSPPGQERVLEPFDPTGQEGKGVWLLSRLVPFEPAACCRVVLAPLQYPGIWWPGLDPSPDQLLPEAFVAATTHRAGGGPQETGARKVEHGMVGCDQHRGHFGQPRNGGNEIEPNGAKHGLVTLVMIGGRVEALPRPYVVATYVASADDGSEIVFIGHQDRPDEH